MTTLVIGLGRLDRGDDGIGPTIAGAVRELRLADVDIAFVDDDLVAHSDVWPRYARILIVDAVRSGSPPGTVHRFDVTETPLPATVVSPVSTHAVPIATAIELARRLGRFPKHLMVIGVEATQSGPGRDLSPETRQAIATVVDEIRTLCAGRPTGD